MRRWAVLAILTYRKYVPVAALRPPRLKAARYAFESVGEGRGERSACFSFKLAQTGFATRRQAWLNLAHRCVLTRGGGSRRYDALAFGFAAH